MAILPYYTKIVKLLYLEGAGTRYVRDLGVLQFGLYAEY